MNRFCLFATVLLLAFASCSRSSKPFFFVQISDPQMGFKERGSVERSVRLLDTAVAAINRLHPAFVVVTGDLLTHWNNEEELQAYRDGISSVDTDIPVYVIPGNHDYRTVKEAESGPAWFEHFGDDRFEFFYGGSYFIGINSNYIKDALEEEEQSQWQWLITCLESNASKADHVILFTHCSIIREDPSEEEDYFNFQAPYREKYLKLCKDYGIALVLSGHYHRFRSVSLDGTTHVTCTSSGWPLGDGFSGMNVVGVWPDRIDWAVTGCNEAQSPLE